MSDNSEQKKKKKKKIEYNIDPSLPEAVQRKLRKEIRAKKRAEREERRRRKEAAAAAGGVPSSALSASSAAPASASSAAAAAAVPSPAAKSSAASGSSAASSSSRPAKSRFREQRQAAGQGGAQRAASRSPRRNVGEAGSGSTSARKSRSGDGMQELAAAKLKEQTRRRRRQEKEKQEEEKQAALREKQIELERLRREEAERQEAARQEEDARRFVEEERLRMQEEEKLRKEEELRRAVVHAERKKRREKKLRVRREEERRLAALRSKERQEHEKKMASQMARWKEQFELSHGANISEREKRELLRQQEQAWRAEERKQRLEQLSAERLRLGRERLNSRYNAVLDAMKTENLAAAQAKGADAGNSTQQWMFDETPLRYFHAQLSLQHLAHLLEAKLTVPEFVVIGTLEGAPGALVDALLDMGVFRGLELLRPVSLSLICDADGSGTIASVEKDEEEPATECGVSSLNALLAERNRECETPIEVQIRHKTFWTCTFHVLPAATASLKSGTIRRHIDRAGAPQSRLLLWTTHLGMDEEEPERALSRWMTRVDPLGERSVLVYNGLLDLVPSFASGSQLNRFFSRPQHAEHVFFVTYRSGEYSRRVVLADSKREEEETRTLGSRRVFDEQVGVPNLARHLSDYIRDFYCTVTLPEVHGVIERGQDELTNQHTKLSRFATDLTPERLRSMASRYLMQYFHAFRKALMSSLSGDALRNGETVADERRAVGEWVLGLEELVRLPENAIPHESDPLIGSKQFKRLLAEFSIAMECTDLAGFALDLPANTAPEKNMFASYAYTATDVTQKRAVEIFRPLAKRALARAVHIAKRLTDVTEAVLAAQGGRTHDALISLHEIPSFRNHIRDAVHDFITHLADVVDAKVEDELRTLRQLPWDVFKFRSLRMIARDHQSKMMQVEGLTDYLLLDTRDRFIESVQLKLHDILWEPLSAEMPLYIQAQVTAMQADDISSKLDVHSVKTSLALQRHEVELRQEVQHELSNMFQNMVDDFAHY